MATAIVSPRARPRARKQAATIPGRAYGSTTDRIICQRVAPRASAPSRCELRDGLADVVSDGGNVGHDHDRQDQSGGQDAGAAAVRAAQPVEQRLHDRRQEENAPEAVDDARNGRQQLDQEGAVRRSQPGAISARNAAAPTLNGTAIRRAIAEVVSVP